MLVTYTCSSSYTVHFSHQTLACSWFFTYNILVARPTLTCSFRRCWYIGRGGRGCCSSCHGTRSRRCCSWARCSPVGKCTCSRWPTTRRWRHCDRAVSSSCLAPRRSHLIQQIVHTYVELFNIIYQDKIEYVWSILSRSKTSIPYAELWTEGKK